MVPLFFGCMMKIGFRFANKSDLITPSHKRPIVITSKPSDYLHKCSLDTLSHRKAIKKSGLSQPDVESIKQVIAMMRYSHLENRTLRAYLSKHVHSFTTLDDQWLRNFRRKVEKYCIDPTLEFSSSDLPKLNYSKKCAAEEDLVLDSDLKKKNFKDYLLHMLSDSGEGWTVIKMLSKAKEDCEHFDFRIWFKDNSPIGVSWVTNDMRNRMLRHSDIVFLDCQKRQYNKHGWVYIGPCIKDHENRIGTIIKSIVIEESIDAYCWVLSSMMCMEPKFKKENIKLMFGDEFLTDTLLEKLDIQDTCTLRCDTYHLTCLNWPKHFTPSIWKVIEGGM